MTNHVIMLIQLLEPMTHHHFTMVISQGTPEDPLPRFHVAGAALVAQQRLGEASAASS